MEATQTLALPHQKGILDKIDKSSHNHIAKALRNFLLAYQTDMGGGYELTHLIHAFHVI